MNKDASYHITPKGTSFESRYMISVLSEESTLKAFNSATPFQEYIMHKSITLKPHNTSISKAQVTALGFSLCSINN